ncbi:MAG: peptidoglycan endopeptidase [Caulobacteraceae bacterium]|nr:peptidoglycan endopeptidase [Caulobacteraceae bacterium]
MIDTLIRYAIRFVGVPYIYGGNNPMSGMDCSGFVCECLKAVGIVASHRDYSARDLFKLLKEREGCKVTRKVERGCVLFFGKKDSLISHVAIAISDKLMIESGGGDAGTISKEKAEKSNAFVRIRPIRNDLIGIVKIEF